MQAEARRQYSANQLSLAFLTSAIITLQANRPDKNADTNPSRRERAPTEDAPKEDETKLANDAEPKEEEKEAAAKE